VRAQLDLMRQQVLVQAIIQDHLKSHPPNDEELLAEYNKLKASRGDKEYKARHILVDKDSEANEIIAQLKKGTKFEDLAKQSKDPGSKEKGGDLDWNTPATFVKPFAEALAKLEKGKYTETPVQTQFGWHVIQLDDVRSMQFPAFDTVKQQLLSRLQEQEVQKFVTELRSKAKIQYSTDPLPRVAEHAHPRAVLSPALRMPGLLHRAEDPLGMGHQNGETSVTGGESGDPPGRSVRIERIDIGRDSAIVHEAQRGDRLRFCFR